MVALLFFGSTGFCSGQSNPYKVRDSNEEYAESAQAKEYARSFAPDDSSSGGFYGAGFHFPDFFNGNKDGEAGDVGVEASFGPFPTLLESRSSDSAYIFPAGTYKTAYDVRPKTPVSRSHTPVNGEYRQRNPILTLYDDWSPDDQPRHKWSPKESRNNKWSQEHTDDSGEVSTPLAPYRQLSGGPYASTGTYNRPYSQASLKQHYKPINPPGKTHLPSGPGEVRTHTHKYGVNHVYDPRKKAEEPNYDQSDDRLNSRKPQKFSSDPNPHQKLNHRIHPSRYPSRTPNREYRSQSYPTESHDRNFSPPEYFRNFKNFDFFTDSSNTAPTKVKAVDSNSRKDPDGSGESESSNDQLDKSCKKSNKTTTINLSDGKISLQCYDCYDTDDTHYKRPYEQCVEVPDKDGRSRRKKRSVQSGNIAQTVPIPRGKRQHDDYYEGDGNYGPDSSDYRFGPEHFADDYPSAYDDGEREANPEYESEKCFKSRKGDMMCISCENKNTGGTYEQCSYASDPRKNSYERSVSKVFGSPRLPDENRRKQVEGTPSITRRKPQKVRGAGSIDSSGPSYPRGTSSYTSSNGGYEDGSAFQNAPVRKKVPRGSVGTSGQNSRFRGSQSRSPLPPPARSLLKERSLTKTPASTSLKSPSRIASEMSLKTGRSSYLPTRNPPPSSRAYSTPSPVGPDPYSYDLPDPYNPDLGNTRGKSNRKNYDASYEPGYDDTFADLFPELMDTVDPDPSSAVALAPPSYDEYPDTYSDYDDVPVRRRDRDSIQNGSQIHPTPTAKLPKYTSNHKPEPNKRICKRTRKNKMTCLQCVDEKGAKQEECSYETQPKSKHTRYREVEEMLYEPSRRDTDKVGSPEEKDRSKRKSKKYNPEERRSKATELGQKVDRANVRNDRPNNTVTPSGRNPVRRGETREKREETESPEDEDADDNAKIDKSTRKNYNPIPTDPPELNDFGETMSEGGEFSADTEMKFDPALGMSLPKYMLEKSEGEAIFDEVLGSSYKDE